MVKIYTRTGDEGETSLLGGVRVSKNHVRIEAIGGVDEANAALGVVRLELTRSGIAPEGVDDVLERVQHELFDFGAELAMPEISAKKSTSIAEENIVALEAEIDRCERELAPLRQFILPGGAAAAAQLHLARCICRRAERRLVELAGAEPVRGELIRYMNRLSDLLFVLARYVNKANRVGDVTWQPQGDRSHRGDAV
jgi:cob(I)alamin adenosyltransferase